MNRAQVNMRSSARAAFIMLIGWLACFGTLAFAQGSQDCIDNMQRETFRYWPNGIARAGDIRLVQPRPGSDEERRALHEVLWPTEFSAQTSIRGWLLEERFGCIEEAFHDLDRPGIVFANGKGKSVAILSGMADYVTARGGVTDKELQALMAKWREAYPDSTLVDILWARLLNGAAWEARGDGDASTVTPEGWEAFDRMNKEARKRLDAAPPAAKAHLLWRYVMLRVMADTKAPAPALQDYSLASLRQYPDELELSLVPAGRLLPQWGGSSQKLETFATKVHEATRARHGARAYAMIYTRLISMSQLPRWPNVRLPMLREGLMSAANASSFDDIARLQMFACAFKDEDAFKRAQDLWQDYARQPQVRPPDPGLPASCRDWQSALAGRER